MAQRRIEYQGEYFEISYQRREVLDVASRVESTPDMELSADSKSTNSAPIMLFLHGWGSNKEVMKVAFENYFKDFLHIYVDMPGFGNSPNTKVLHTQDYAQIMQKFLYDISGTKTQDSIIVGHSFGGKVAILCEPREIILLSSAGILVSKSLAVRAKIMLAKIMGKCGLSSFGKIFRSNDVKKMSEVMYQTFKNVVDEDFSSQFATYKGKASIFWGKDDKATSLVCGERMTRLIQKSRFFALEGDHYFFLKQGKMIENLYRSAK